MCFTQNVIINMQRLCERAHPFSLIFLSNTFHQMHGKCKLASKNRRNASPCSRRSSFRVGRASSAPTCRFGKVGHWRPQWTRTLSGTISPPVTLIWLWGARSGPRLFVLGSPATGGCFGPHDHDAQDNFDLLLPATLI